MKKLVIPFCIFLVGIMFVFRGLAAGFAVIKPTDTGAAKVDPFRDPGPYAHWNIDLDRPGLVAGGRVLFNINVDGSDDVSDFAQLENAVTQGAEAWNNVETATFRFHYGGPGGPKNVDLTDSFNTVFWDEGGGIDASALAETSLRFDVVTGEILNADIGFNGARAALGPLGIITRRIKWSTENQQGKDIECRRVGLRPICELIYVADIQATATHEFGHVLGLHHSEVRTATMGVPAPQSSTEQRSLEDDDNKGVTFLYPFIYVSSFTDGTILKIDSNTGDAEIIGSGLVAPEDMAFDSGGILYIGGVFTGVKRIDTNAGVRLTDVGTNICGPEGPAIDLKGNVFLNTRLGPCDHSGAWKVAQGKADLAEQVLSPFSNWGEGMTFLKFGPFAGHLVASDSSGGRIIRSASPDFGTHSELITGLCVPVGIAMKSNGEIFVSDACGEIRRYDSAGNFLSMFASGLSTPLFIEFDGSDSLYVTELDTNSVLKFASDGTRRTLASGIADPVGLAVGRWP